MNAKPKPQPQLTLQEAIVSRRAARAFRSDPIPDTILEEIFRLGLHSPSGYNLQPWRFIVVKEQENKERLVDVCCLLPLGYADEPIKKYGGRLGTERVCYGESFGQALG